MESQRRTFNISKTILNYIPSLILEDQLESLKQSEKLRRTIKKKLPMIQPQNTVCLFADISGFTNISETCAKMGSRGCEELAFCMNRYMEGLVKGLSRYGGDIIKFIGDAMIVLWPRDGDNPEEDLRTTARKAIQSALDIQAELDGK